MASPSQKKKSGEESDDVTQLLGQLTIVGSSAIETLAPPGEKFKKELGRMSFRIFACVSDLGFFRWVPKGSYKGLADICTASEILSHIEVDGAPDNVVQPTSLSLPQDFRTLPPQEHNNKYPYGQYDIACLHVASCRGLELKSVDFAFGGSTLEMLARQDTSSPYYATLVPGTKMILVVKRKEYTQNYADPGFQFERLVTGKRLDERLPVEFNEHMHVMMVGKYRVLFRAEADALDQDGEPVEAKASNPRYWGTKVMFQMISSGSPTLCQGTKRGRVLSSVTMKNLSQVADEALHGDSVSVLEDNIIAGMDTLKNEIKSYKEGEVLKVDFSSSKLVLLPVRTRQSSTAVLPSADIVKELIL